MGSSSASRVRGFSSFVVHLFSITWCFLDTTPPPYMSYMRCTFVFRLCCLSGVLKSLPCPSLVSRFSSIFRAFLPLLCPLPPSGPSKLFYLPHFTLLCLFLLFYRFFYFLLSPAALSVSVFFPQSLLIFPRRILLALLNYVATTLLLLQSLWRFLSALSP